MDITSYYGNLFQLNTIRVIHFRSALPLATIGTQELVVFTS